MTAADDRWVTFDCFGTLVDWHNGSAAIVRTVAGDRTPELLQAYHRFERLLEQEAPHRLYRDVLSGALQRAAGEIGMTMSDADARRLPDAWGTLPVFGTWSRCSRRCGAPAAASRCSPTATTICSGDERGFRERFDLVVTAERVRDYKPALAHFRYFARSTGASRDRWIHVACSWYHDVAPARELALRPRVARPRPHRRGSGVRVGLRAVGRGSARRGREALGLMNIQHSIAALLQRDLAGFEREIGLFPDDGMVWRTLPGVQNSAGNLALHVAGNLQHFVGAVLGGSAYVRDEDGEFSRRSGSRREIVEELQKAAVAVRTVLPNLGDISCSAIFQRC